MTDDRSRSRSGSSPAARASTATRRSTRWPSSRGRSPSTLDGCRPAPVTDRAGSRCSPTPTPSAGSCSRPTPTTLHRRDRLDAHLLAGEDVDRRAGRAAQAVAAPAHPGQRRAALGRDRHGLHEPQPGRARRPRVRLHPDPARRAPQDRRRPRDRPAVADRIGAWVRAARGCARHPSLRLARFGDNMRNVAVTEGDKVEAELRFGVSVNTYGVNDLVAVVDAVDRCRGRRAGGGVRRPLRRWPPSCARRATARVAALRRADRAGPAEFLRTADSAPSPRTSRISAGCGSCPASPSSG